MGKYHDVQIQRPRMAQDVCTTIERRTGSKNIVGEHIFQIVSKAGSRNQCKGIFEVGQAAFAASYHR